MRDIGMQFIETALRHRGKITGTVLALIMGWIFLEYGFARTMVVLLFLFVGYTLGARRDAGLRPLPDWITRAGTGRRR